MGIIITWNLRHGGGSRVMKIIETLKQHGDSMIIVLTEFRNNKNALAIKTALSDIGFIYHFETTADPKKNSVLITSKIYFESQTFPELNSHSQRVIKIFNEQFSLYGCYFPLNDEKKEVFDFLLSEIDKNLNDKIIITGDFNTGKHYADESGATFFHSDYLDKIESKNFFDAWRYLHGDKKEFTWYSNAGNGFRLDHFFVHNDLKQKITRCEYIHGYRENKITDHSMMFLELAE